MVKHSFACLRSHLKRCQSFDSETWSKEHSPKTDFSRWNLKTHAPRLEFFNNLPSLCWTTRPILVPSFRYSNLLNFLFKFIHSRGAVTQIDWRIVDRQKLFKEEYFVNCLCLLGLWRESFSYSNARVNNWRFIWEVFHIVIRLGWI